MCERADVQQARGGGKEEGEGKRLFSVGISLVKPSLHPHLTPYTLHWGSKEARSHGEGTRLRRAKSGDQTRLTLPVSLLSLSIRPGQRFLSLSYLYLSDQANASCLAIHASWHFNPIPSCVPFQPYTLLEPQAACACNIGASAASESVHGEQAAGGGRVCVAAPRVAGKWVGVPAPLHSSLHSSRGSLLR